ncbi:MAG TPA: phenylalanine--tRNA ligase subunit beta [Vicinamibacterales bacterium]|nr:phenylalanine--tRNA ligase subunit beta [Vicinamibacterales bacterium]
MRVPVSWLREFADVPADAKAVASRLGACGFNVEGIEGEVVDFEITANRPDCLSVYGLAREAAAAFGVDLRAPELAATTSGAASVKVSVGDPGCGRYALAVADVMVGPSPDWLAARLTAAGVRPINNVVDVTNYVMLELGHPMHAFDVVKLAGPEIRVRRARGGERLTTLDGQNRALDETMLVIADRDRPVAIAGLMGGADSEVSSGTTKIAIESAWFQPVSVRTTSKKLGLKTEASARFERGADLTAPVRALARFRLLLEKTGAGKFVGPVSDIYPHQATPRNLALDRGHLRRLLGDTVPDADVERILTRLGFAPTAAGQGWSVAVPAFRVDVAREADLIEEVGRHWGFDRIPASFPALRTPPRPPFPGVVRGRALRRLLCGAGLQEAVTFTFIEDAWAAAFAGEGDRLTLTNPLSEKFATLRPSLVPGLVDSLAHSRRRESADVRLFEIGTVFSAKGERQCVGWVLTGSRGTHWSGNGGPMGFTDAKGVASLLAAAYGREIEVSGGAGLTWCREGRSAHLQLDGATVGWIGQLSATRGLGPADEVFAGELDLDALGPGAPALRAITPLPRFPSIVRDLSIVVSDRLPAADVRGTIRRNAPATLVAVREFDRYQGQGVPSGQISLSLRLTFRAGDRTLTDMEVQQAVDAIVAALVREHGAVLRGGSDQRTE